MRIIVVKLADRLHNMRTLESMPPHKQKKIADETLLVRRLQEYRACVRMGLWTAPAASTCCVA